MSATVMESVSLMRVCAQTADRLAALGGNLGALRRKAWQEFIRQGIPTTKHEEWRYTPLRALTEMEFSGNEVNLDGLPALDLRPSGALTLSFVNGVLDADSVEGLNLPGISIVPILEAYSQSRIVSEHFGTQVHLDEFPFAALNTSAFEHGVAVIVEAKTKVEQPIHFSFATTDDGDSIIMHPRILVLVGAEASVNLVESYVGSKRATFTNAVTELFVGKGAVCEHTKVQREAEQSVHIALIEVLQERDSTFTSNNASFGAQLSRNDINVHLNGENCHTWLNGAYVGSRNQIVDNHTRLDHAMPNCNSFEVYKGVLDDRSVGVFNGKIFVHQDAQKTDAKQTNQAILLSRTAAIDTKPQLEIYADDVKCTHGATVGQLREDALFYLQTRGIPTEQARALLVYAFVSEVIEKISIPDLREALEAELFQRLAAAALERGD